ncbi:MAG: response regulator [Xanthobacteraceae bacterium]|nr:response regulator [Xanthobacteraceae bacterium]
MFTASAVTPHLPNLRRYARAVTGSQTSGDTCVAAVLDALSDEPELLTSADPIRVALYRLFTTIWISGSAKESSESAANLTAAERRLTHITPKPRQAFLLVSVEGFSEQEAARILDVGLPLIRELVEEAGRELAAQTVTNVLIIEDEALIALELESLVEKLGHQVVGVARTRKQAIQMAQRQRPGLVLADIQLADGSSGLDAVNDLLSSFEVPVIFITAYPERFLSGERPEPAFLVEKPFQPATVSALVSQALFFERNAVSRRHRR